MRECRKGGRDLLFSFFSIPSYPTLTLVLINCNGRAPIQPQPTGYWNEMVPVTLTLARFAPAWLGLREPDNIGMKIGGGKKSQ